MFVSKTKTNSGFKATAFIAIISVLLIVYMMFSFASIGSERILMKLPLIQPDVETVELEQEVERPPITRKSASSVLKIYLFRCETQCCGSSFINRLISLFSFFQLIMQKPRDSYPSVVGMGKMASRSRCNISGLLLR
jgi:hypothetical protein